MDTTNQITPSNANGFSESNCEGQVSPTLSKEVGGGNAKECGGSKNLQVVDGMAIDSLAGEILEKLSGLSPNMVGRVLAVVMASVPRNHYTQQGTNGASNHRN